MKTTWPSTWHRYWVSLKASNLLYSDASHCVEFANSFSDGLHPGHHLIWCQTIGGPLPLYLPSPLRFCLGLSESLL